ncbi:MAG: hypothetical protein ACO293_07485 [Nitrosopumilaceae archaeon]
MTCYRPECRIGKPCKVCEGLHLSDDEMMLYADDSDESHPFSLSGFWG